MKRRIFKDLDTFLRQSGVTVSDLAAELGVSQAFISQIRHGKRTPSLPLACRLAEAARVPIESLISTTD